MPTVHEVLKASGMTDDQIASLDTRIVSSLKTTLETADSEKQAGLDALQKAETEKQAAAAHLAKAQTESASATAAREQAERERLSNVEFYEQKITPALAGWDETKKTLEIAKANAEAKAAFYETQIVGAKAAGFLPTDAPAFALPNNPTPEPQRGPDGRFVPGAPGSTPGSPTFMNPEELAAKAGNALSMIADVQFDYQRLYGQPMPMLPSQLVAEAEKFRLDPKTFAEKQFKFPERRAELAEKAKTEERAAIAAEATKPFQDQLLAKDKEWEDKLKARDREWAERTSSNPDLRVGQASKFSDITRAVKENQRPDPLNLNTEQRRMATRSAIHNDVAEQSVQ